MQLDRFLAGHLASLHSPTRERGELYFASDDTKKPVPSSQSSDPVQPGRESQDQAENAEFRPGTSPEILEAVSGGSRDTHDRITALTASNVEQIPEETFRSETVYRAVLGVEITPQEAREKPAVFGEAQKIIESWRTDEEPSVDQRAPEIEKLLKSPDILARAIRQLDERIERDHQVRQRLALVDSVDPELVKDAEQLLNAEQFDPPSAAAIRDRLRKRSKKAVFAYNAKLNGKIDRQREALLAKKVSKRDLPASYPIADAVSEEAFLQNLVQWIHDKRILSGYAQREILAADPGIGEDKAEDLAIRQMREQSKQLRRALDSAIRQRATEAERENLQHIAVIAQVKPEMMREFARIVDLQAKAAYGNETEAKQALAELRAVPEDTWAALDKCDRLLVPQGISIHALCIRQLDTQKELETYKKDHSGSAEFAQYAPYAIGKLRELDGQTPASIAREHIREQEAVEEWAAKTEKRLEDLKVTTDPRLVRLHDDIHRYRDASAAERKDLRTHAEAPGINPLRYPAQLRAKIDLQLDAMEHPRVRAIREDEEGEVNKVMSTLDRTPAAIRNICQLTRRRLDQVIPILEMSTKHDVTRLLGLPAMLTKEKQETLRSMEKAQSLSGSDPDKALWEAARAQMVTERMERAQRALRDLPTEEHKLRNVNFAPLPPGQTGLFEVKNGIGKITVSDKRRRADRASTEAAAWPAIDHERGHAIMQILTRTKSTRVFPFRLWAEFERRKDEPVGADRTPFGTKLEALATVEVNVNGTVTRPYAAAEQFRRKPEDFHEELFEELIMRWSDWKKIENDPAAQEARFHPLERDLFASLERDPESTPASWTMTRPEAEKLAPVSLSGSLDEREYVARAQHGDETEEEAAANNTAASGGFNAREELNTIADFIRKAERFHEAYYKENRHAEFAEAVLEQAHDVKREYKILNKIFVEKDERARFPNGRPEDDRQFQQEVRRVSTHCGNVLDNYIRKVDVKELDTTNEVPHARKLSEIIRFWSINDIIKFSKDTWEDIQSIYKRGQDRRIKEVGEVITQSLKGITTGIGSFDRYAKGLNAYHKRRYSGTEVEAANKWKEGMENEDSHTLLHFLHETTNKDAVRGIISLLTHRGEMDWDDYHVWETLNKLSRYKMPIGPCRRDDILRDTWLRKVITEIYDDRELYYHWRTENDSKIKSGKGAFTDTADQLSNVGGGMRAELEKQLRLKDISDRTHSLPPEDVKPHLYEEVLEYAIRNGKMSMEDKFYYLINGVAKGILGIERLRSLAGEKGEILMKFPFIDFFYQKNNSIEELRRFAQEIQEAGEDKKYKPGLKTTLFLYYKVTRNEGVRARISKATSRIAEGIDHEDVPFMITQLDWGTVRNLADVISGSRQKITFEGWKNAYIGFNTHMKVFGELANLDDKGMDRLTKHDGRSLAQTITSYIFMDNILTSNGGDGKPRPTLTEDQLDTRCPSGDPTKMTREYRVQMNKFLRELFSEQYLGPYINANTTLRTYKDKNNNSHNLTLADFAPILNPEAYERVTSSEKRAAVFAATPDFGKMLAALLQRDDAFDAFKRFLRSKNQMLINEGSQFTRQEVETIVTAQRATGTDAPIAAPHAH